MYERPGLGRCRLDEGRVFADRVNAGREVNRAAWAGMTGYESISCDGWNNIDGCYEGVGMIELVEGLQYGREWTHSAIAPTGGSYRYDLSVESQMTDPVALSDFVTLLERWDAEPLINAQNGTYQPFGYITQDAPDHLVHAYYRTHKFSSRTRRRIQCPCVTKGYWTPWNI